MAIVQCHDGVTSAGSISSECRRTAPNVREAKQQFRILFAAYRETAGNVGEGTPSDLKPAQCGFESHRGHPLWAARRGGQHIGNAKAVGPLRPR